MWWISAPVHQVVPWEGGERVWWSGEGVVVGGEGVDWTGPAHAATHHKPAMRTTEIAH